MQTKAATPISQFDVPVMRAKVKAALRVAWLIALTYGTVGLGGALVLTALLSGMLHLNFLLTLAGSIIGLGILFAGILPVRSLWRSSLIAAYQEERLFELANALAFQDVAKDVEAILDDRYPVASQPDFVVRISGIKLMLIRQGQMRKSRKLAQYLYRTNPENAYHLSSLASLDSILGYFDESLEFGLRNVKRLNADASTSSSPALATSFLCLIGANLYLHRQEETEKWLEKLKAFIELKGHSAAESNADRIVRIVCNSTEFDSAFYNLYLAKFKMWTKQKDARETLMKAEKIVARPDNQKRLQLFYPEIVSLLGEMSLMEKDYKAALTKLEEATKRYDAVRYRGPDYYHTRGLAAFAKWKVTGANPIDQLESAIRFVDAELEPNHPRLGALLECLGEAFESYDKGKAREAYERALSIYKTTYPAEDPDIQAIEQRLQSLAL